MPSVFDLVAVLLVLTAAFGWLNHVVLRLPHTIGLLVIGLAASLTLIGVEAVTHVVLYDQLVSLLQKVDFKEAVLDGMLAFLLFAGALHVDLASLRRRALVVGTMATIGVVISTAAVGVGLWLLSAWLGSPLPLAWALVFGALISPTDPVAVLSALKAVRVPERLETDMTGESLFNDGVGVVVFTVLVAIAAGAGGGEGGGEGGASLTHVAELFFLEAGGGALLGLVTGYVAYRATRALDEYAIEVLITLALVTGTYALAAKLHTSGPIAVVVAGILLGNRGPRDAMSEETQKYLFGFWTLIDEILNSLLFLLIGLEVLVLRFDPDYGLLAAVAVPLVLVSRLVAVSIPVLTLHAWQPFLRGTIPVLTWGALRGGISIALALSLPEIPEKGVLLTLTYAVVVFSIVVQGLTLQRLARKVVRGE
ncbi:Na+/H+ antiporter NhaP [Rhodovulum sp. PH10]|uniref:cation:proton antiporter n=1 Tax=Rhodovulum sp. PH10 TaxID=1187851 RepID=UPI00027C22E3|nr:sodium:proton antiporter [Rhodovulum sp. PH10]EJW13331.1 Na+/H+ antiporter NhaP [Rhodovulum sp. PH10]